MRQASYIYGVLVAVFGVALSGCASEASLTILTEPPGGYITEMVSGHTYGTAPVTVTYDPAELRQNKDASGCFNVNGFEARWGSGAVSREDPLRLCGPDAGRFRVTIFRQASDPGLATDQAIANQLRNAAAQKQQADAAALAAAAAMIQGAGRPTYMPQQPYGGRAIGVGFLKREYTSGFNKICIYDRLGSEVAVTIGAVELCPLNLP